MTIEDLARLALACRDAQRTYFATRTTDALQASKTAERRLDEAIARVLSPQRGFDWEG